MLNRVGKLYWAAPLPCRGGAGGGVSNALLLIQINIDT